MRAYPNNVARYPMVGSPILGSKYFRDYCCVCGEPMRVDRFPVDIDGNPVPNYCGCLDGPPPSHTGLCKRQRVALQKTDS